MSQLFHCILEEEERTTLRPAVADGAELPSVRDRASDVGELVGDAELGKVTTRPDKLVIVGMAVSTSAEMSFMASLRL